MKLKDFCDISAGGTPSRSNKEYWDNGNIPWLKISDLKNKYIDKCDEYITEKALNNSSAKLYSKGTILYTIFATIGEVAILDFDATTNQAIAGLKINDEALKTEYLYYYLKSLKQKMVNESRGVAQNNINLSILRELDIRVPSIDKQNIIIEALSKMDDLIETKKNQIVSCNNLIKSQFVEMFNDKTFEAIELNELCDVRDGTHDSPKYLDSSDYKFITSKNIIGDSIDFSDCKYIKEDDYNKFNQRSKVNTGDILMPMIGTIGNPIIVNIPEDEIDFAIKNVALIKFTINSKVINVYIKSLLNSDFFENAISQNKRGGTQKFIALSDIRKIKVPVPPIELQNKFAQIVEQIDKQKFEFEKSLKKLEELQASLMKEYFG